MINNMQVSQIDKVTDGSAFLPSDYDHGSIDANGVLHGGFSPQRLVSRSLRSPQTIVPFDDFSAMFNAHLEKTVGRRDEKASATQAGTMGTSKFDIMDKMKESRSANLATSAAIDIGTTTEYNNNNTVSNTQAAVAINVGAKEEVRKDIVHQLAKKDPEFEVFLKNHSKARPMSEVTVLHLPFLANS
jgi:hypothetical protein